MRRSPSGCLEDRHTKNKASLPSVAFLDVFHQNKPTAQGEPRPPPQPNTLGCVGMGACLLRGTEHSDSCHRPGTSRGHDDTQGTGDGVAWLLPCATVTEQMLTAAP